MTEKTFYTKLDGWIDNRIGTVKRWRIPRKQYQLIADTAHQQSLGLDVESALKSLSDLRHHYVKVVPVSDEVLQTSLAALAAIMMATLQKRPYPNQLFAAVAMYRGCAAQMATGEGKTLVAGLCAALYALSGRGCHVATANEYLAARDAELMLPFYQACGFSVASLTQSTEPDARPACYQQDILYSTGNNFLADYLRDCIAYGEPDQNSKRLLDHLKDDRAAPSIPELHSIIVDEADSVLADDATTPLIISQQRQDPALIAAIQAAFYIIEHVFDEQDFQVHAHLHYVSLNDSGADKAEQYREKFPASWRDRHRFLYAVNQALSAQYLYEDNKQYVIQDDKIVLVDEKTGRLMPDRHLSDGLHQAIEVKEGVQLSAPTIISAKMSFQSFYRKYQRITGMSGTFAFLHAELWRIYKLPIAEVSRRKPRQHLAYQEKLFVSHEQKLAFVIEHIVDMHQTGRPILVGTTSVKDSIFVSEALAEHQIPHRLLNALSDAEEAEIIAHAGETGSITVATNMAGRGTDIAVSDEVEQLGGLHVVATERNVSRRVDIQLFGRASRQGQAGSSISLLSLEDQLPATQLSESVQQTLVKFADVALVRVLAMGVIRFLQWRMDQKMSGQRLQILFDGIQQQKLLSFSKQL